MNKASAEYTLSIVPHSIRRRRRWLLGPNLSGFLTNEIRPQKNLSVLRFFISHYDRMRLKNDQLAPLRVVTSAENKESSKEQRYSEFDQ